MLTTISACEGDNMPNKHSLDNYNVTDESIDKLSNMKIFFGHQSVGGNILDGLVEILNDDQRSKLHIVKSVNPDNLNKPGLMHFYMGENGDPLLKLKEFSEAINSFKSNKPDIALFKFCFLDIDKNTDINQIFNAYKNTINQLKAENPETIFAHITVPLTVKDEFLRAFVKRIIGRPDNNINRALFNEKIIDEYSGKDPIFDLATIESTKPDGTRASLHSNNIEYFALADEYAADSGHLNTLGQMIAAEQLVNFLNKLK